MWYLKYEPLGNLDGVEPIKEVIGVNVETKNKNMGRKMLYADIFIHRNDKRNDAGAESSRDHQYTNYDIRPNLCSSYDDVKHVDSL